MLSSPVRHTLPVVALLLFGGAAQQLGASPYKDEIDGPVTGGKGSVAPVLKKLPEPAIHPKVQRIYDAVTNYDANTGYRSTSPDSLFHFMPRAESDVHARKAMDLWITRNFTPDSLVSHFAFIADAHFDNDPLCESVFIPRYAAIVKGLEKRGIVDRYNVQGALIHALILPIEQAKTPADLRRVVLTMNALHNKGFKAYLEQDHPDTVQGPGPTQDTLTKAMAMLIREAKEPADFQQAEFMIGTLYNKGFKAFMNGQARADVVRSAGVTSDWRRDWTQKMFDRITGAPVAPTSTQKKISSSAVARP